MEIKQPLIGMFELLVSASKIQKETANFLFKVASNNLIEVFLLFTRWLRKL